MIKLLILTYDSLLYILCLLLLLIISWVEITLLIDRVNNNNNIFISLYIYHIIKYNLLR